MAERVLRRHVVQLDQQRGQSNEKLQGRFVLQRDHSLRPKKVDCAMGGLGLHNQTCVEAGLSRPWIYGRGPRRDNTCANEGDLGA